MDATTMFFLLTAGAVAGVLVAITLILPVIKAITNLRAPVTRVELVYTAQSASEQTGEEAAQPSLFGGVVSFICYVAVVSFIVMLCNGTSVGVA